MPSPMVFCYNLIPALPTSPKNPTALAIGAGIKAGKNPPICVGENLISQVPTFSYFFISPICFSLNLIALFGLSVKSNLILQSIIFSLQLWSSFI
jgi:hypothetical protein